MSKYHKLTNNDSTTTLLNTDDETFAIFCNGHDANDDDHSRLHYQRHDNHSVDDDYRADDLLKYNDTVAKRNANNNSYNNNNGNNNNGNNINRLTRCTTESVSGDSSNNLLITTLDVDDSTMEIPLLQHGYNNGGGSSSSSSNNNCSNFNIHKDDLEYACLCQQKGFASNLSSKSTQTAKSKILWAIGMCCIFMIVEFLGGYIAGSLAIMTDAAHLASDCISFVIGLVAIWLGQRPPDAKMSFGYKRLEVLGAIVSILGIWILTATLVLVAIQRVYANDYDLNADTMMAISGIGILINIIMIFILHSSSVELPEGGIGAAAHGHSHSQSHNHGHNHSHNHHGHSQHYPGRNSPRTQGRHRPSNDSSHLYVEHSAGSVATTSELCTAGDVVGTVVDTSETTSMELSSAPLVLDGNGLKHQQNGGHRNLNLRAAMIHVIGDLVQSFGVFLASVLIKIYPKAVVLDPLCTLLFSVIVIMTTVNLFRESMHILMDSVPQDLSLDDLEMDLLSIEGVKSVHHLNVWNHTSNHGILMAHLVIDFLADSNTVLMKATQVANGLKYNMKHSTIQIERATS